MEVQIAEPEPVVLFKNRALPKSYPLSFKLGREVAECLVYFISDDYEFNH